LFVVPLSLLAAGTGERRGAERAQFHAAADVIPIDRAGEFERHWHGVGDRYLPRRFVAIDRTVENVRRISAGRLAARERIAVGLHRKRGLTVAHWRRHQEIPVAICAHVTILSTLVKL